MRLYDLGTGCMCVGASCLCMIWVLGACVLGHHAFDHNLDMRSSKSTVASEAARAINSGLKVNAMQNRVSPDTEDVFNDSFWEVCVFIKTLVFCALSFLHF